MRGARSWSAYDDPRGAATLLGLRSCSRRWGCSAPLFARETEIYFINAIVAVAVVVALYIFVGNSGVLSFGHISFVAVGAWSAGVLSVPIEEKAAIYPNLFGVLGDTTVGNVGSLLAAASSVVSMRCSSASR